MTTLHLHSSSEKPKRSKAPSIFLTEQQKWEVATYCIENRGVVQEPNGKFTVYRVGQTQLAKEVSENLFKVNNSHIVSSMQFYNTVCELTANLPVVPQQESMQEEMLRIEIIKLKTQIDNLNSDAAYSQKIINDYKERFAQITKLAKT